MYTIFWFRRDLRIKDNHALYQCLKNNPFVLPIFIFDENILNSLPKEDKRVSLIFDALINLKKELEKQDSSLLILYGKPESIFKVLLSVLKISNIYLNHDYEPYAIRRDKKIRELCQLSKTNFFSFKDQVIFEKEEILSDKGEPIKVYSQYKKHWFKKFSINELNYYPSENYLSSFIKQDMIEKNVNIFSFILKQFKDIYKINTDIKKFPEPDLNKIGFKKVSYTLKPLNLKNDFLKNYDKTRDYFYLENGTSNLSVYLRFGFISIREVIKNSFEVSLKFIEELIWREFYMYILYHYPESENEEWNPKYKYMRNLWRNPNKDPKAKKDFELWCNGLTGFPLVDAGMRQLNQTGYIHNRVRMVCANFLVKDLLIDWKLGERYFALKLMDFELASNVGNWQWCSGTGVDAAPYFRIFNPLLQQKKFDPEMIYCKTWIKELETGKYIKPILDHNEQKQKYINLFNKI